MAYDVVITTHGTLSGECAGSLAPLVPAADAAFPSSRFRFASEGGIAESGLLFQCLWFRCLVDEAHIARNPVTRISNAISKVDAVFRWLLTGCVSPLSPCRTTHCRRISTPMVNSLLDYYPYHRFLRYKPWCIAAHFKTFIVKVAKTGDVVAAGKTADAALSRIMIRRRKDDLLDGKPLVDLVRPFVPAEFGIVLMLSLLLSAESQDDGADRASL